ncbi:beta-carotene 15,15'-dioxygenase, Brp/Blh family [Rhodococcus antarcticus]|uniref:Probable beta-carotene 15,15'-dioxygenase n=1 Tax=Rhodococcus antarcticus TaxID=2987751 RepID=A0ABY6P5C9_9NOCA|nr:beta-carotene 15,15'-dioxygenase, Brp/Blh family [Rhodococcus antarcticus]UZJ26368.1 beta-carotene 15,15'-dioxygenase, Brp/Blh family [Rhodococcus antarcticus]
MTGPRATPRARTRGGRWDRGRATAVVGTASVLAVAAAAAVGVVLPASGAAGPALLVVAGVLGLPHGAVDHLAMGWSRPVEPGAPGIDPGWIGTAGARPALLLGYALLAAGVAWAALVLTVPAVLVLLVLSCAHFAEGELAFARLRGEPGSGAAAAALGTAVIAGPLLLRPDAVRPVLDALDPGLAPVLEVVRTPVLLVTGLLVLAGVLSSVRRRCHRQLVELAVVVVAGLVAPPLLVFAAWFGAWHAPRHLVRLLDLEPDGGTWTRVTRLGRAAVLPTGAALAALGALVVVGGSVPASVLVVLLALTVPHAAVVARLGRTGRSRPATSS